MKATGEGSVGLLVLAASPGDEIVSAAAEALRDAKAGYAWIVARGTLREAMVATGPGEGADIRVLAGPLQIASASGIYRAGDESIDLTAVVVGPSAETTGGRLAAAVAEDVEIVCFIASPSVARTPKAAPPMPLTEPVARAVSAPIALGPSSLPSPPPPFPSEQGAPSEPGLTGTPIASTIPQKLARKVAAESANTIEPEAGDTVTHFAFGDCDVESSDGDRIRLRQRKDDRVREVSLEMLRIEAPTTDDAGKRHFKLSRKN